MPDLEFITEAIRDSLDELLEAAKEAAPASATEHEPATTQ
jgi:hypothetical protein